MNKASIFLLLILLNCCVVKAQQNKFTIGIVAGPGANYLYGYEKLPENNNSPLVAFSAGITFQYNLPKVVSFVSGILYEKKGEKFSGYVNDFNGQPTPFVQKYLYNYMTVPLLARFSFGKKALFFAEGGGFASYLLNSYIHYTGTTINYQNGSTTDLYKRLDAGVSVGLGVSVPLGEKLLLTLEAKENLGLIDISKFPVYRDKSIKTNSINVLVGIAYKLGKRSA